MKPVLTCCLLLLLCIPGFGRAELPQQLQNDFSQLSGYIIMPVGDEYLIDLDASSNLKEGDILTLVAPGEKVIHPVTKEVLGSLDVAKGFLQVTRLKSGYSYARLLSTDVSPVKGDQVKRFEQVPARFTAAAEGPPMAEQLKAGLPQLNWLSAGSTSQPLLTFALSNNALIVTDKAGSTLKAYQYADGKLVAARTAGFQSDPFSVQGAPEADKSLLNKTVDSLLGSVGLGGNDERLEGSGIIQSDAQLAGIWMGPNLDGNPIGVSVADFNGDGILETAIAMEDQLLITAVSAGKLEHLASIGFASGTQLLSVDAIDLDGNGTPEIYLSAASGEELNSQVVEYQNGTYQRTRNNIPWFFRVADLPGEGRTLLAQSLGSAEAPFGEATYRVLLSGNELIKGQELPLPEHINLFSFSSFTANDGNRLLAYVTTGDYLKVTSVQGTELWESSDYFGGTEVSFYPAGNQNRELIQPVSIQQRLVNTASGELLVVQNEGIRTFQRFRNFSKGRVVALAWNGFALQERWKTSSQNGYLADFALADADNDGVDELVLAMKFQQKNILQKGRSTVVIYELQ